MTPAVIVALIGVGFSMLATWAGVVIWAVRQEGRVNAAFALIEAHRQLNHNEHVSISERLSDAISALAKFDENTQEEVKGYRLSTEVKIEELGRKMDEKFDRVFDRLDQKQDKP